MVFIIDHNVINLIIILCEWNNTLLNKFALGFHKNNITLIHIKKKLEISLYHRPYPDDSKRFSQMPL